MLLPDLGAGSVPDLRIIISLVVSDSGEAPGAVPAQWLADESGGSLAHSTRAAPSRWLLKAAERSGADNRFSL